jgi:hypothetical protein
VTGHDQSAWLSLQQLLGFGELQQLQRTLDLSQPLLPYMQINRSCRKTAVAQEPLHGSDLNTRFQQVGGEAVSQRLLTLLISSLKKSITGITRFAGLKLKS